jgi:hypothetical protein
MVLLLLCPILGRVHSWPQVLLSASRVAAVLQSFDGAAFWQATWAVVGSTKWLNRARIVQH